MPLPGALYLAVEAEAARRVQDAARGYLGACTALEMAVRTGRGLEEVERRHGEWLRAAGVYWQTVAGQGREEVKWQDA